MSLTLFGPGPVFTGPVTINAPADTTKTALTINDSGTGRSGAGQEVLVNDHNGSPIWSVPPAGGPAVYGDQSRAGQGVLGPFMAMDGPNLAFLFSSGQRFFSGSGAPGNGLGNVADWYGRTDTPGTANQRLYIKTAAAVWTAVL